MLSPAEEDLVKGLDDDDRVVMLNLRHDWRIGIARLAALGSIQVPPAAGGGNVPVAHKAVYRTRRRVRTNYDQRVAVQTDPDYLSRLLNGHNFVPLAKPGVVGFHPDTLLVHVLDLTQYFHVFLAAGLGSPGAKPTEAQRIDWLKRRVPAFPGTAVAGQTQNDADIFVGKALDAISNWASSTVPSPVWVALWNEFRTVLPQGPNAWLQVLGMSDQWLSGPRYPLVLAYKARSVGTLVRPTQLEASWNALHFPSPDARPVSGGGLTMDRSAAPCQQQPLCEYLHAPKRWTLGDWIRANRAAGPTVPGVGALSLQAARQRHLERIKSMSGTPAAGWMRDVTCLG